MKAAESEWLIYFNYSIIIVSIQLLIIGFENNEEN